MAPTDANTDIIPRIHRNYIFEAVGGDHKKIAGLWAFMRNEGYAEQARLAKETARQGIISRAAAKFLNKPSKTERARDDAHSANTKGRGKGK